MTKKLSIHFFSLFFIVNGILHFTHTAELATITPLPFAHEIVWITGIMEFLFAVFLQIPKYRRITSMVLSVFLLAVLTANINMALNQIPMFGAEPPAWALWLRVFMQFPLIAWILWATDFKQPVKTN